MRKIGIILDTTIDKFQATHIFKDASNVSLFFIKDANDTSFNTDQSIKVSPKAYIEIIKQATNQDCKEILILTSSQKLTPFYENAQLAKDILSDVSIDIIDSKSFGPGILYVLMCMKLWNNFNYSYQKMKALLTIQIDKGATLVVTKNNTFMQNSTRINKLLKPLVKGYILSSDTNYHIDKVIYNSKKVLNDLYLKVMGHKGFNEHVSVFVYSSLDTSKAKLLQHELYTKNKDLDIRLYGRVSQELMTLFGKEAFGIYIGYYEEAVI
ncbi:MAG: DegV family protein [Acholeplasma sp.]